MQLLALDPGGIVIFIYLKLLLVHYNIQRYGLMQLLLELKLKALYLAMYKMAEQSALRFTLQL